MDQFYWCLFFHLLQVRQIGFPLAAPSSLALYIACSYQVFHLFLAHEVSEKLNLPVYNFWFYLASKFTCILCLMHQLVCLGSYQITLYLAFLYVSLYLIMYFQQFKWFLNKLLLDACILRYSLLLDVLIDICFVFTMYLINLAHTNRRYSGYCF